MTPETFLTGFCGGLAAFACISLLGGAFLLYWIRFAPMDPDEQLLRQRYGRNGTAEKETQI
jgi:hypothetical protein